MVGILRRRVRELRARRALQPQLWHHGHHGLHCGLCAVFRTADRRGPQSDLDREDRDKQKARGTAAWLGHRHEGHGGCAVCGRPRQMARHGAGRRGLHLSQGLRRGHRIQRRSGPLSHCEPHARDEGAGRSADCRGREGLCDRRRGASARQGRLSRRLEEQGREAEALLHGLPAYVA